MNRHYNFGYGYRSRSNWGDGDELAPYAEGDIVAIPATSPAFTDGRIPHTWSRHPELCKPGLYRVVAGFSIGEGPEWYFRVCPIVDGRTLWDEVSDRLHVVPDFDATLHWTLVRPAKPKAAA